MYLSPLIRINRAVASTLILPDHPVQAIALSEMITVFAPLLNPSFYSRTIVHIITFMYNPRFAWYILKNYEKADIVYNQAEISLLILFNIYLIITKFYN